MDLSKAFPLNITEDGSGKRLDQFLAANFSEISRSRWARLSRDEKISVNGKAAPASKKLVLGDVVDVELEPEEDIATSDKAFKADVTFRGTAPEIIFEDDDILVLNKPVGLGVHPGSGLPLEETLVAWLMTEKKISGGPKGDYLHWGDELLEEARPGIVHRLDKGTSGAIVVAKNPKAHSLLAQQFESKEAGRIYWAVVDGSPLRLIEKIPLALEKLIGRAPAPAAFRVSGDQQFSFASFLRRDPRSRVRFAVSPDPGEGKKAITHFGVQKSNGTHSLLRVELETGRTHQIRVHLSFLGFPLLGDDFYGGRPHPRLMLHAQKLKLKHPKTKKSLEFLAPLPVADREWLQSEGLL